MVAVSLYPALSAGFVGDDVIFVQEPAVRSWSGLWTLWFSPADMVMEQHYWPVMYTTFWLEHKLWGLDPFRAHLVNVLLYMGNVLLLWRMLRYLRVPGAWAVAAVFAVHPMHVESVALTLGRKDLLCGLFCMAAALCWIRSLEAGTGQRGSPLPAPGLYLAALGLFVAAMLSKSAAVTLPVAFALWLWWKNGRLTWAGAGRITPFFVIGLGIAVADLWYYASGREFDLDYGLPERVLIAAHALWFYAGKLVWPTDLAVVYPLWEVDVADPLAWGYVAAAAAVAVLLWACRHRWGRAPLAGAIFFLLTLSPALGFVSHYYMQYSFVADRYAYLAGIGVLAVLIGATARGVGKFPGPVRIGAWGVLVAVLAVFGKLTWEQAGIYRDKIPFYNHIVSLNPGAQSVYPDLANALIDAGRLSEALSASRVAVELSPDSADAHTILGASFLGLGRLDEAEESFRQALELDPDHKHARYDVAEIRRAQRRFAESIESYLAVLDIDPDFAPAHAGMGEALFRLGRYRQAVESLGNASSIEPLPISQHYFLAEGLRRQQRFEEAVEAYRHVLEIDPEHDWAHAGIGYAWFQMQRYEEALESVARSVSLRPESPDGADRHVVMGRASLELGRMEAAAEHYERALKIDPGNVKALDSLALLRFGQQRYEDALRLYEALIEIGEANARVHANVGATLFYLDRPEQALSSLDRAFSMDPALAGTGFKEMRDTLLERTQ